jgi:rfaE bifunctional protein nucleotidyltransferase chain/domain
MTMSAQTNVTFETLYFNKKYLAPEKIEQKVRELKGQEKTIVTLNGSFDLLHAGHLEMLTQASCQGDVLIVALNSDASIKAYKSPKRPIIELKYRLQMISALAMVTYVTWFDETDPRRLLGLIAPHVHVNGAEYGENCIEAEVVRTGGGRLHVVPLVPGLSTSNLIEKIKKL